MTSAERLGRECEQLLMAVAHGASDAALDPFVMNVKQALADSFANGDTVRIAGTDQILFGQLEVLNVLSQGRMIDVVSATSAFGDGQLTPPE